MSTELNGWNIEEMNEAIEAVKQTPQAGQVAWRSRVIWDGGFGLDVRTSEIEQLGEVMKRHFTLRGDHPPQLLGENTGPTAIETLLGALGACMAGTFAAQATARGVELEKLELDLEGVIDLNGFFGLKSMDPGLFDISLNFRVRSSADESTLQEILDAARRHSPVHDTVTRPVKVDAKVAAV
jgi:uncharacterized OsmC-like protein